MEIKVNVEECISCGACESIAPDYFEIVDKVKVKKKKVEKKDEAKVKEAAESCPVDIIKLE